MNYKDTERQGIMALSAIGTLRSTAPRTATFQGKRPNVAVGALIVSPAVVRDKLNEVNRQVNTLDSEIKTNVQRSAFLSTWGEFKNNWQKFYDDHQSLAKILLTGTGTLDRKANEYQAQLSDWYSALKQENPTARLVFPPPLPPTAPPTGPSVPWWGVSLLTLLGTGAVVYATYASYLYIQEAKKKKQFLEEEVVPRVLRSRGIPAFPSSFSSKSSNPDSMTRLHAAPARDPASGKFQFEREERLGRLPSGYPSPTFFETLESASPTAKRERERQEMQDPDESGDDPAFGGTSRRPAGRGRDMYRGMGEDVPHGSQDE